MRRLLRSPICERCGRKPSTVPDHIVPLSKGGADIDSNIRCLCAHCHEIVTVEQFGDRCGTRWLRPKQAIGSDGWPED